MRQIPLENPRHLSLKITLRAFANRPENYPFRYRSKLDTGIKTKIGCHTFRATDITAYLKSSGRLEIAQQIAEHESSRTAGLSDHREDDVNRAT